MTVTQIDMSFCTAESLLALCDTEETTMEILTNAQ